VRWSKVCTPISEGGLGIRNLPRLNHALLGKWLWRYGVEREAWWILNIEVHGECGWCSMEPVGVYGVGLWKNIIKGWGKFSSHTRFEVGDGFKVRFLHDLWCGDMASKEAFLGLFGIACAKDAFDVDHVDVFA
jgi:hypothetical protein